ncbi:MAG TPA: RNA methyltransferase [Turneriella sp.]|nr:RNA methyltransferase [Turneriella sp.]
MPSEAKFLTERRRERILNALNNRTRRISVLLEDIYDPLNGNAVLRTADGLGIQDIYVAENRHAFNIHSKVSGRASAWLTLHRFRAAGGVQKQDYRIKPEGVQDATRQAYESLRSSGYTIIATSPRGNSVSLRTLDMTKKYAIALGSEHWGLSDWAIENADMSVALPMLGFTESYNISVTGAMILHYLSERLRSETSDWRLSDKEKEEIWNEWTKLKR